MVATRSTAGPEIVVVHNPQAGGADAEELRRLIDRHFADRRVELCECSFAEDMAERLAPWLQAGVQLVIVAGGDGTISDVAGALAHGSVPMGILPQGTGNVLAREIDIPLEIEEAAALLAGNYAVRDLDVMRVGKAAYLLSVSVGLSADAMKATSHDQKQQFGRWAYWIPFFQNFFGPRARDFQVRYNDEVHTIRATDLLAVNAGIIGFKPLRWGPEVQADDGVMNLCYLKARSGLDYLWAIGNFLNRRYLRNSTVDCIPVQTSIFIQAPENLPVQADGDWIGYTPVEVILEAGALKVAVPLPS
jgi:diacylglycerol kinase (ATP)